jgi:ribosomal protein L44E
MLERREEKKREEERRREKRKASKHGTQNYPTIFKKSHTGTKSSKSTFQHNLCDRALTATTQHSRHSKIVKVEITLLAATV